MKEYNNKTNSVVQGLLDYLDETGSSSLLSQLVEELQRIAKKSEGAEEVRVTSFIPLTEKQKEKIQDIIVKFLGSHLPVVNTIDKKLLGGFTVQVGDWFLDASLVYEFNRLKSNILS